jgi:uncharacterized membrane protein
MTEKLANYLVVTFGGLFSTLFSKYIFIFLLSVFPILELRGGLIVASLWNLNPLISYIICIIGNIIPIPFILLLLDKLFNFLKKKGLFTNVINKLENKALKQKDKVEKYSFLALLIFVAVPIPGSGGWTGALIASVLRMDKKKSFITICMGILIASIIMMLLSFGLLRSIIG